MTCLLTTWRIEFTASVPTAGCNPSVRERKSARVYGRSRYLVQRGMESAQKAENRKAAKSSERKSTENDSEEELQPPSPIHIAPEAALVPDFDFPDPQELRRIESDTQSRLKAILEVAGVTGLSQIDAQTFQDPEILRKLTNRLVYPWWSCACHMNEHCLETHVLRVFMHFEQKPESFCV